MGKLFLWQINSMLIDHIIHVPLLTPLHFSKRCMKSNKFVTSWNIMIIALVALHEGSQKSSIKVSFRCTLWTNLWDKTPGGGECFKYPNLLHSFIYPTLLHSNTHSLSSLIQMMPWWDPPIHLTNCMGSYKKLKLTKIVFGSRIC